jgi:hypothetical protein
MLDPDMSGRLLVEKTEQQKQQEQGAGRDHLDRVTTLQKADTDFVDKWSQQISSKLLLGWRLLDEVCVRAAGGCSGDLPLVKDLAGEVSDDRVIDGMAAD